MLSELLLMQSFVAYQTNMRISIQMIHGNFPMRNLSLHQNMQLHKISKHVDTLAHDQNEFPCFERIASVFGRIAFLYYVK